MNVVVAAYTTACARLRLHSLLTKAGEFALYADTDSIIYIQPSNLPPLFQSGHYLGDLTNELEEYGEHAYITDFVSLEPKSYAFRVLSPETGIVSEICKVKGITLNHKNKAIINFESMLKQLTDTNRENLSVTDNFFVRTKDLTIHTLKRKKEFKPVITKRRIVGRKTYPYGYNLNITPIR